MTCVSNLIIITKCDRARASKTRNQAFDTRDKTCSKIERTWFLLVHWGTKASKTFEKSRSSCPEVFCTKGVKTFAKFAGKHRARVSQFPHISRANFAILFSSENIKRENFLRQACFLHPGNQVCSYHAYIFSFCDIINYLYIR